MSQDIVEGRTHEMWVRPFRRFSGWGQVVGRWVGSASALDAKRRRGERIGGRKPTYTPEQVAWQRAEQQSA